MKKWFYSILLASVAFAFSASAKVCFLPNDPEACFDDLAEINRNNNTCVNQGLTLEWALCKTTKYDLSHPCKDEIGPWYSKIGCADGYMDLEGDKIHYCEVSYEQQLDPLSADCADCCPASVPCKVKCIPEFKFICERFHNSTPAGEQCADCYTGLNETNPRKMNSTKCICVDPYNKLCTGTGQIPYGDYCLNTEGETYYQACKCNENYKYECKMYEHNVGKDTACENTAEDKKLYTSCQCNDNYVERTSTTCSTLCPKTKGYTGNCAGVNVRNGNIEDSSKLEGSENYCIKGSFHCETCAEGGYTKTCVGINLSPENRDDYCEDANGVKLYKNCEATCASPKADFDNYWQGYGVNTCHNLTVDCTTLGYDSTKTSCKDGSTPYKCPFDHAKTYCPDQKLGERV